jgi:hypothetical protein
MRLVPTMTLARAATTIAMRTAAVAIIASFPVSSSSLGSNSRPAVSLWSAGRFNFESFAWPALPGVKRPLIT